MPRLPRLDENICMAGFVGFAVAPQHTARQLTEPGLKFRRAAKSLPESCDDLLARQTARCTIDDVHVVPQGLGNAPLGASADVQVPVLEVLGARHTVNRGPPGGRKERHRALPWASRPAPTGRGATTGEIAPSTLGLFSIKGVRLIDKFSNVRDQPVFRDRKRPRFPREMSWATDQPCEVARRIFHVWHNGVVPLGNMSKDLHPAPETVVTREESRLARDQLGGRVHRSRNPPARGRFPCSLLMATFSSMAPAQVGVGPFGSPVAPTCAVTDRGV